MGNQAELFKSYLAFVRRALSRNWIGSAILLITVVAMTIAVAKFWPRTYHCEARLMAEGNDALAGHGAWTSPSLRSASSVLTRHETLESIIKSTDLVHLNAARRPPILQLKDRIMEKLGGKMSDEDAAHALVWTLEQKAYIDATDQYAVIGFDWSDAQTSAMLVQAGLDKVLEARHTAEISGIAEYISILESHASTLRNEVETLAAQVQKARADKRAEAKQRIKQARENEPAAPIVRRPAFSAPKPTEDAPNTLASIEEKRRALNELETTRQRRLSDLQAKYDELKTRYTPAHPVMEDLQQQINILSHESAQATQLKSELRDLESQNQKRANSVAVAGSLAGSGVRASASADNQLPEDIVNLLNNMGDDDIDPALGAQFGYALSKFSTLRTQISEARIDLDTAQAAFTRRYKVVAPPEVPGKPIKPKVPVILGVGVFLGLVLALLLAIGRELRRGKIVERWQVQELALPVLAELQFPPSSPNE